VREETLQLRKEENESGKAAFGMTMRHNLQGFCKGAYKLRGNPGNERGAPRKIDNLKSLDTHLHALAVDPRVTYIRRIGGCRAEKDPIR